MTQPSQTEDKAAHDQNRLFWFLAWAARIGLALMFFYSGFIKAGDSKQFLITLTPYTFLPDYLLLPVALGLPWLEILLAFALLLPWTTRLAAVATVVLMAVFIATLWWALANGIVVDCGCFGRDEAPSEAKMLFVIVRDAVIAFVAAWLVLRKTNSKGLLF